MDHIRKQIHDEWGIDKCPKCFSIHMLFWNSKAIWCLTCKWVKYKKTGEEVNRHIPKDDT